MSLALFKKSLELSEKNITFIQPGNSKLSDSSAVESKLKKCKTKHNSQKTSDSFLERKNKKTFQLIKTTDKKKLLKQKLKQLNSIDQRFDSASVNKVQQQRIKYLQNKNKIEKSEAKKIEKSVFTEEDFEKMNDSWLKLNQ